MYNFNNELEKAVRLQLVKEFIEGNDRVPEAGELNDLITETYKNVSHLPQTGLIRNKTSIDINEESSAEDFNSRIIDYWWNADFLLEEIEWFYEQLSERAFVVNNYLAMLERRLRSLNNQSTSLLLAKGISSNLLYSITEDFTTTGKIVLEESSAAISSNGVQCGTESYTNKNTLISKVSYTIFSQAGYKHAISSEGIDSLVSEDGNFWTLDVFTNYSQGNVATTLEVELTELTDISSIEVALATSTGMSIAFYIADESKSYNFFTAQGADTNLIKIYPNSSIRYLKIMITKQFSDSVNGAGDNIYTFKIDSIKLGSSTLENGNVLIAGPYKFTDAFGEEIPFTFAQLSVCEIPSSKAWIDYFLSTDSSTWIPVDPTNNSGSIISFKPTTTLSDLDVVNSAINQYLPDYDNVANLTLETNETYINNKIDISYLDKINPINITVKRNVPTTNTVFDIDSGWFFDTEKNLYTTTIFVDSIEGLTIDLGSSSAYLDGVVVTGSVLISAGRHLFETNQSNWFEVETDLETEDELSSKDPLYPYNHKLIIEGYSYPTTFIGNKLYNGMSDFYGSELQFVSKSEFQASSSLNIYTIDTDTNYIYFLVHTLKSYDDWKNEKFDIDILLPNSDIDSVYLKAVFRSSDNKSTTILKNFTIRAG